jgi:predicted nucleic acid-binding protein
VTENLVLDNTILSHFARTGELETLRELCVDYRVLVPVEVHRELLDGVAMYPSLANAIALTWTTAITLEEISEVVAFALYSRFLDAGEAAVLAFTKVNGGLAIIDELAGRREGRRDGLEVQGTLWLILEGIHKGVLSRQLAEELIDALVATEMRLPTDGAGFIAWAYSEGLLPKE